jgi:hypothetical protein
LEEEYRNECFPPEDDEVVEAPEIAAEVQQCCEEDLALCYNCSDFDDDDDEDEDDDGDDGDGDDDDDDDDDEEEADVHDGMGGTADRQDIRPSLRLRQSDASLKQQALARDIEAIISSHSRRCSKKANEVVALGVGQGGVVQSKLI